MTQVSGLSNFKYMRASLTVLESIELPRQQTAWCMCSISQRGKHSTDPVNFPPAQLGLAANSRTYNYTVTHILQSSSLGLSRYINIFKLLLFKALNPLFSMVVLKHKLGYLAESK